MKNKHHKDIFHGASSQIFRNANRLRKNMTEAEKTLWQALRNRQLLNVKFRRQHPIAKYVTDFYCRECNLVIELDGGYHNDPQQQENDEIRSTELQEMGLHTIRFKNEEVMENLPDVLEKIKEALLLNNQDK